MPDFRCELCGLKPWDADDLIPGDMVCVCDDLRELEPDFVIGQFMPVLVGGDYMPPSVLKHPWQVALWLEYGRRGGVPPEEVAEYRSLLSSCADARQLEQVMRVCADLERLTEAGDADAVGAYLDAVREAAS